MSIADRTIYDLVVYSRNCSLTCNNVLKTSFVGSKYFLKESTLTETIWIGFDYTGSRGQEVGKGPAI